MVTWAKENAVSSGLADAPIRWIVDDCKKFVEREIRRGNHYDAIIMDPPSYGRGPKGEIWKIEDAIYPLIELCAQLLTDQPLFFLVNSYTTGLQPAVLHYMISTALKGYPGSVRRRRDRSSCFLQRTYPPLRSQRQICRSGSSDLIINTTRSLTVWKQF